MYPSSGKYVTVKDKAKSGLECVGAAAYAMHPTTRVLCCAYDDLLWRPELTEPQDLLNHVENGGMIRAHNAIFEHYIWTYVCTRLYGWPELKLDQLICTAAAARHHSLPGGLEMACKALRLEQQKDMDGSKLMRKLSTPGNPPPTLDELQKLYAYCKQDTFGVMAYGYRDRRAVLQDQISEI